MNHFFANVNEVLQELWNVDFFRVAFALIVFLLIANIIREIVKEIKKSKIKRKAKRISRHGADLYGDSLWITKRNPYFAKIIKIIPHKMNITAYKPESYVYTGATVGVLQQVVFIKRVVIIILLRPLKPKNVPWFSVVKKA